MQATRTFRIFVSSTFSDLKAERDALQENVFPRLRELAAAHGCGFQVIDLRWGVSEEAALDQQTMKICLSEIERCQRTSPRPNFIVLLGDRYGWRPLPYEIPGAEFDMIIPQVSEAEKTLLEQWYRLDQNALPPVYCLLPRSGDFVEYQAWEKIENKLHEVFRTAIEKADLSQGEKLKYSSSATEQEIVAGALQVQDAPAHVQCYFREIKDLPRDRTAAGYEDLDLASEFDAEANGRLTDLKARLKESLPGNTHTYLAHWLANGPSLDHLDALCADVYRDLEQVMLSEIRQLTELSPLELEINAQEAFGQERRQNFFGRADVLKVFSDYLSTPNSRPMLVLGSSGTGKSALMAKAIQELRESDPHAHIILRFVGATPVSSNPTSVQESICQQIYEMYDLEREKQARLEAVKGDTKEANEARQDIQADYKTNDYSALGRFVKKVPPGNTLILFIDALDQFSHSQEDETFGWLPLDLPDSVHMVISSLPGDRLTRLLNYLPAENILEVKPLSSQEGDSILTYLLGERQRTLQERQKQILLSSFSDCGLPLYLKMVFEEACRWKSYDPPYEFARDISGMIRQFFARLSLESNHGRDLVAHSLGYLAAAKNGLAENELLDILSRDKEVYHSFLKKIHHIPTDLARAVVDYLGIEGCAKYHVTDQQTAEAWYENKIRQDEEELDRFLTFISQLPDGPRLPTVLWSRLYFDLQPYLTERSADGSSLLSFYHRQLGEVAETDFLSGERGRLSHQELARYFNQHPLRIERDARKVLNLRKLSELAYHQTLAGNWTDLEHNLSNLNFIEAKFEAGLGQDLLSDYANLRERGLFPWEPGMPREVAVPALEHEGKLAVACPHCMAVNAISAVQLGKLFQCPACDMPLRLSTSTRRLAWQSRPSMRESENSLASQKSPFSQELAEFAAFVNRQAENLSKFASMTFQQAINEPDGIAPARKAREMLANGKVEFAWLEHLNKSEYSTPILPGIPSGILFSPDGQQRARLESGALVLIKAGTNIEIARVNTADIPVTTTCFSPDSRSILAGFADGRLAWIRSQTGQVDFLEIRHQGAVRAVQVSLDGRRVLSCAEDARLLLLLTETGAKIGEMLCEGVPLACAFSADETQAYLVTKEAGLLCFDLQDGSLIDTVPCTEAVTAVAFSSNLGWLAMASASAVTILDLIERKRIIELPSLYQSICGLTFSPDNSFLTMTEYSGRMTVYTTEEWKQVIRLDQEGNTGAPYFSPDGHLLVCGADTFDFDCILAMQDLPSRQRFFQTHMTAPLAYTLDGSQILAASDTRVGMLDSQTGKVLRYLPGRRKAVSACAFFPNGDFLIAEGPLLRKWDASRVAYGWMEKPLDLEAPIGCIAIGDEHFFAADDSQALLFSDSLDDQIELKVGSAQITAAAFSPSDEFLVTASQDKTLRVWGTEDGQPLAVLNGHSAAVRRVAVSADDLKVVSYSDDQTVRLWSAQSGVELSRVTAPGQAMLTLGFSSAGDKIAALFSTGELYLWDAELKSSSAPILLSTDSLTAAAFSSDGSLAVMGTSSGEILVWDLDELKLLSRNRDVPTPVISCAISSSQTLLLGFEDSSLELRKLDALPGKIVGAHEDRIMDCDLTYDLIATVSMDGSALVLDSENGEVIANLGHSSSATACVFSEDCRNLVTGDYDGIVHSWQLGELQDWLMERDRESYYDQPPEDISDIDFAPWTDITEYVYDITCSPDGEHILVSAYGEIRLLMENDPDTTEKFPEYGRTCFYSRDGKYIIIVSGGETQVWGAKSHRLIKSFPGGTHICGITRDGKWIINGDRSDEISIWSFKTGREVIRFFMDDRDDWPLSLAVSSTCDEFATMGVNGKLRILRYHIPASLEKSVLEERAIQKMEAQQAEAAADRKMAALFQQGNELSGQNRHVESIALFQKMGRLARENEDPANLWLAIYNEGLALFNLKDYQTALDRIREAEKLGWEKTCDHTHILQCIDLQARILKVTGKVQDAYNLHVSKESWCKKWKDLPGEFQALMDQAALLRLDDAIKTYARLERLCRKENNKAILQECLGREAELHNKKGRPEKAQACYEEKEQLCRELGHPDGLHRALSQLAAIHEKKGDLDRSLGMYEEVEKLSREIGKEDDLLNSLNHQGLILRAKGDLEGALAIHAEAEAISRRLEDRENLRIALANQAIVLKEQGELALALRVNQEVVRLSKELENQDAVRRALSRIGGLYQAQGDLSHALAAYQEEEIICRTLDKGQAIATCLANQAEIYLKLRELSKARTLAHEALEIARARGLKATEKEVLAVHRKLW